MSSEMKVKALAPWFGGKRTMAPAIAEELGKHSQYFEPFCGSMAVLFAKPKSQKETVNDLHGDLINLARVVADPALGPMLYQRLQRVFVCEDLLDQAAEHIDDEEFSGDVKMLGGDCKLDRAYWYFLACWMSRNGTAGTLRQDYQIAVRWTSGGGSPTVRWRNAVESIPQWHQRLSNVVILNRDAFTILDRFEDSTNTAIYIDSPYVIDGETRSKAKSGHRGADRYLHEFSNRSANNGPSLFESDQQDDHERLRDVLATYNSARVVVSYYDCQRVRELYDGWTFVEHTRLKHLHNQSAARGVTKNAPEVLIINGPSYAKGER